MRFGSTPEGKNGATPSAAYVEAAENMRRSLKRLSAASEAADLVLCELLVGEVGQRRPPPQAQSVAGQCRRLPGIVPERGPRLLHEGLEV